MTAVLREFLVLLLLMVANGAFALSEVAILSARKGRLQQWANEGNRRAQAALDLARAPNLFLSSAQVGMTSVSILAGAYGEATLADQLESRLRAVPALAGHSRGLSLAIVVVGITYLTVVLGELVPKRLALQDPERLASKVARSVRVFSVIASPIIRLLSLSTDLVLKLLGVGPRAEAPVSEEEIKVLIEQGTEAGLFEEAEQDMVERVFRLGDRRVSALMTPRTDVRWLDLADPPEELKERLAESPYSRFPVGQGSLDDFQGMVHVKDLLGQCLIGQPLDVRSALRHPLFVPESMRALKILELFKQSGTHVALVMDEFGGVAGLVTFNDVLEALVGDIPSADEEGSPQVVQREDGTWLVDGMLPVDEFKDLFDLAELPSEERGDFQTLGGFVMTHIGRIPVTADHFHLGDLRFEVVDMDGNRVDKVLVSRDESAKA